MGLRISRIRAIDRRYELPAAAGSDSMHPDPAYSHAVTLLELSDGRVGTGLTFTLGRGNEVVVQAIKAFAPRLIGADIDDVMSHFAVFWRSLADESQLRWLGPHKGVIHLALASISSALVDAWAQVQNRPLWKLLLEMSPEQLMRWTDLTYLTDFISPAEALDLLSAGKNANWQRHPLVTAGYPAYNTSVGWLGYDLDSIVQKCRDAVAAGFTAVKLKVGSPELADDVRRVTAVRAAVGPGVRVMIDANQRWSIDQAIEAGRALEQADCFWLEEPTHPDDILGYSRIAREVVPLRLASGEGVSNAVLFKNLIQARGIHFVQADVVRLGGLPEYLGVVLMAKKAGLPIAPHGGGDFGLMHQHLVTWQAVALGMEACPLEYIPHVNQHFAYPVKVVGGRYQLPQQSGASLALDDAGARAALADTRN